MQHPRSTTRRDQSWLSLVWETGGAAERMLLVAFLVGMAFLVVPLVIVLFWLRDPLSQSGWFAMGEGIAITGSSWIIVYPTVADGMHTSRFYRAALERGREIPPNDREYVVEWATVKEKLGVSGQFPNAVRFAYLYLLLYVGMWCFCLAFVILFYPILTDWTVPSFALIAIPLYAILWLHSRARSKTLINKATLRGLPLTEVLARQNWWRRRARPPLYPLL